MTILTSVNPSGKEVISIKDIDHKPYESKSSAYKYISLFVDFLNKLGLNVQVPYATLAVVVIEDVQFDIYTDNATYATATSYGRNLQIRKPEKRFISLLTRHGKQKSVIKVILNKEYEVEKLILKIEKYIQNEYKKRNDVALLRQKESDMVVGIGTHYSQGAVADLVNTISINKGEIWFHINWVGCIKINAHNNMFISYSAYNFNAQNIEDFYKYLSLIKTAESDIKMVLNQIMSMPILGEDLVKFANEAYNQQFDVQVKVHKII